MRPTTLFLLPCLAALALLGGCETFSSILEPPPGLKAGTDWTHARLVGSAPYTFDRDPAVVRLTPLVKKDPSAHLQELVDALEAGKTDGFRKARAIHDWITRNIAYDFTAFLGKTPTIIEPYAVILHGSSVCDGYAHLFSLMCGMAGLESQVVVGFGRGYGFDPFSPDDQPLQTNHAWNAVNIDGGWYLVDTTWDAGINAQDSNFTFKWQYSTGFLFTPPDVFLCTHYPEDPRWQLNDQPLNAAQLKAQPTLWGDFGTLGFERKTAMQGVSSVGAAQDIQIRVPPHMRLDAYLTVAGDSTALISQVAQKQEGDLLSVKVLFSKAGRYSLALIAGKEGDTTTNIFLGELFYVSTGGSQNLAASLRPDARESGLSMDADAGYAAHVGTSASFGFTYPGVLQLYLEDKSGKMYENRIRVVRDGNHQVATVSFPGPGEYTVTLAAQSKTDPTRWIGVGSLTYIAQGAGDLEYPSLTGKAVQMGVTFDGADGYAPKVAGETQFSLRVHAPILAILMDEADKQVEGHTFVLSEGDVKTVKVSFPGPGSYKVWISASAQDTASTWDPIAGLHFQATGAGRVFPTVFGGAAAKSFQIVAPLNGLLTAGQDVLFDVIAPPTSSVYVQGGTTSVELHAEAGHFKGIVHPAAGKLNLFGSIKKGSVLGIAEYTVR